MIVNGAQHFLLVLIFAFSCVSHAQVDQDSASSAEASQEDLSVVGKKSLLKSAETEEFDKPLYFDQLNQGLVLPPLEFEYDLSSAEGKVLRVGNVSLSERNFTFRLLPLGKTYPKLGEVLSSDEAQQYALLMFWPDELINSGTLEVISKTGAVLWTYSFNQADRARWRKRQGDLWSALNQKGLLGKSKRRIGIFASQFALLDIQSLKVPFLKQKGAFRFCLSQTDGLNNAKLCSQRYGTKTTGKQIVMGRIQSEESFTPRVLLQNEEAPLKNVLPVDPEMPTSFFAELQTGESYEFVTHPNPLKLMDIVDTKKANQLRIIGYDTRPIGRSMILNPDQAGPLTKMLGFESTIGDVRKFWSFNINTEEPKVYLPGRVGGVFKQRFELSEVPLAQSRVFLHRRTPQGTYIDGIRLEGRKQPTSVVSSQENLVVPDEKDATLFTWAFKATERGQLNRSYLNVEFEGKTYRSYYEIYKGFPRELSGRFTGVNARNEFIYLGEIAYNQWFEDLFGWTDYWFSRQRWGVSAKFFQSLNKMTVDSSGTSAPLSVVNVDLKYRAVPGLWGRDETLGGMISYQDVTFDKLKAPMLGVGAFWARSMPKVFDDLFNIVPIMRYPKWVDMEFIYYASSLNSAVTLNSSMSLNFHGKVFWTDRLFGEAGFGIKRYAFSNVSLNKKAELNTLYGTVGMGLNF